MYNGRKRRLRYGVCGLTGRNSFLAMAIQPYEQGSCNALMVEKLLEGLTGSTRNHSWMV
ncbi:hypothetical protein [Methanocella conradii]|uniref:hypothetical protein n=1 Tax=Methanocella conradii TaxID=1175444 RepID=UPI0013053CBC|nr:hypothetical protein [Methanocella conradii]